MDFIHQAIDFVRTLHSADGIRNIIQSGGIPVLTLIVFAETGLLAGFFLPGDSLLITAGIFTATDGSGGEGLFSLPFLMTVLIAAAIIGDQVGYYLGKKTGAFIHNKPDSFFFKKKHLQAAHEFYEAKGGKALILARFVPILRTFVPFVAGMADMSYRQFVSYNVIGGVVWVVSLCVIGHFLGLSPLANQLHKIILIVIFVSFIPLFVSAFKGWRARRSVPG